MLSIGDSKAKAIIKTSEIFGKKYVKENFNSACLAYPENEDILYEIFCGFERNEATNKWTVFSRVCVNRKTHEVKFLDYKLPSGERMKNPIKPVAYS